MPAHVLPHRLAAPAIGETTEDFESGFADGEPLRVHADWFFEDLNSDPACEDDAGIDGGWGVEIVKLKQCKPI